LLPPRGPADPPCVPLSTENPPQGID
jgi:hypothetical protein